MNYADAATLEAPGTSCRCANLENYLAFVRCAWLSNDLALRVGARGSQMTWHFVRCALLANDLVLRAVRGARE
jgi:hypothetical protein